MRRTDPAAPNTLWAIGNLGATTQVAGDITVGLALREEAAASALRELGPEHPITQQLARLLADMRQKTATFPSGTRATGALVGLASKPELNSLHRLLCGRLWRRQGTVPRPPRRQRTNRQAHRDQTREPRPLQRLSSNRRGARRGAGVERQACAREGLRRSEGEVPAAGEGADKAAGCEGGVLQARVCGGAGAARAGNTRRRAERGWRRT